MYLYEAQRISNFVFLFISTFGATHLSGSFLYDREIYESYLFYRQSFQELHKINIQLYSHVLMDFTQ